MRILYTITLLFLVPVFLQAQKDPKWDFPSGHIDDEPTVTNDQAKVYNRLKKPLYIYYQYESGAWQKQLLNPGYAIYDLDICGKPNGANCAVTIRIYSSNKVYREANLEGGSRYLICYDSKTKIYDFQVVR